MNVRADIAELLHAGHSDRGIARQLNIHRSHVTRARRTLGVPPLKGRPKAATPEDLFWRRAKPVDGGHMEWTGHRNQYGTPVLKHGGRDAGRTHSAYQVAFRIKHGRDAVGPVIPNCGFDGCVAPSHVEDAPMRELTESTFAAIFGEAA